MCGGRGWEKRSHVTGCDNGITFVPPHEITCISRVRDHHNQGHPSTCSDRLQQQPDNHPQMTTTTSYNVYTLTNTTTTPTWIQTTMNATQIQTMMNAHGTPHPW